MLAHSPFSKSLSTISQQSSTSTIIPENTNVFCNLTPLSVHIQGGRIQGTFPHGRFRAQAAQSSGEADGGGAAGGGGRLGGISSASAGWRAQSRRNTHEQTGMDR